MDNQIIDIIEKNVTRGDGLTPEKLRQLLDDKALKDDSWDKLLRHLYDLNVRLEKDQSQAAAPGSGANRFAAEYLESLRQLPVPDEQAFEIMFSDLKHEENAAADHLMEAFLPYIAERAAHWHPRMDSMVQDLIGEGCAGALYVLHDAAMPETHADAGTFRETVCWWINAFMFRFVFDAVCQSGIADHLADRMNLVMNARGRLGGLLGHAPTAAELAEETGMDLEEVMTILGELRIQEKNEASGIKLLKQPRAADIDDAVSRVGFEEDLAQLDIEERYILQILYGIGGRARLTAEEAASQMNMTVEEIRQIETRALSRLKQIQGV